MFKMGCTMARKILPGSSSSGTGGHGGNGDNSAVNQQACFSLGGQHGAGTGGKSSKSAGGGEHNSARQQDHSPGPQQQQQQQATKKVANSSELNDFSKLEDDPRIPLNVRQIFKITKSWKAIARTMSKTGTAMFLNLFEQNQDLFYLFDRFQHLKGKELHESMELREHAATVMSTLDTSINSMGDYDNFVSYLHSIGELHRKVPGFRREYFWKIEQPFMKAVKQTLDERCNETIEEIYKIAIKLIIETIAEGYGQDPPGAGGPVPSRGPKEPHDDDGGPSSRGGGAGDKDDKNNNKAEPRGGGGKGAGKAGFAPHEPSAAGGQVCCARKAAVRLVGGQTKTTSTSSADDFHLDSPGNRLGGDIRLGPKSGTTRDGTSISESQTTDTAAAVAVAATTTTTTTPNPKATVSKCSGARRLGFIVRKNARMVCKAKLVLLGLMQSCVSGALARVAGRPTESSKGCDQSQAAEEQGAQVCNREPDHEAQLNSLVVSTCEKLLATSELIERRVSSQRAAAAGGDTNASSQGASGQAETGQLFEAAELAKLVKWRELLGRLTNSLTGVTGQTRVDAHSLDRPRAQAESGPRPPQLTDRQKTGEGGRACARGKFNIKSSTGSLEPPLRLPTGASDNLMERTAGLEAAQGDGARAMTKLAAPLERPTAAVTVAGQTIPLRKENKVEPNYNSPSSARGLVNLPAPCRRAHGGSPQNAAIPAAPVGLTGGRGLNRTERNQTIPGTQSGCPRASLRSAPGAAVARVQTQAARHSSSSRGLSLPVHVCRWTARGTAPAQPTNARPAGASSERPATMTTPSGRSLGETVAPRGLAGPAADKFAVQRREETDGRDQDARRNVSTCASLSAAEPGASASDDEGDLADFVKLLLIINSLILASASLNQHATSPQKCTKSTTLGGGASCPRSHDGPAMVSRQPAQALTLCAL